MAKTKCTTTTTCGAKPLPRWNHTATTTQRGYGWKWQKLRLKVLERDHYICQAHLKRGVYVPGNDVDHIVSKAKGGGDDMENLRILCSACHRHKTATELHGTTREELPGCSASGAPIDKGHHWNL